ncbi:MAG: Holliday junction resolvase RuvX, partial [Alphaproteobacteria bacterium]
MTIIDCKQNSDKTQDFLWAAFKKLLKPGRPLIGIDYGSVRIGVAVSDNERRLAYPFKIIAQLKELDDIVYSR